MEARWLSLQFPASTLNRILFPHLYPTQQHFPPCWWLFLRVFPLKAFLFPPAPKSPFGLTTVLRMYVAGERKSFLGPGSLLPPSFDCGHASPGDSWRGKYNKKRKRVTHCISLSQLFNPSTAQCSVCTYCRETVVFKILRAILNIYCGICQTAHNLMYFAFI